MATRQRKSITGRSLTEHSLRQVQGMVKNLMKSNNGLNGMAKLKKKEIANIPAIAEKDNLLKMTDSEMEPNEMEEYLNKHFTFRYNLITEQTEYRLRNAPADSYEALDKRTTNTLFIHLEKNEIDCTEHALLRYLHSSYIPPYHPFQLYLEQLPQWDQQDRLTDLASRVSTDAYWIHSFHRWMLALTAQWLGIDNHHANSTAPLLISVEQGMMKSSFCQSLMPKPLSAYYTDQMDINQNYQERKLAVMGLINLDEFDRLSPRHMAQLKNLMQLSALNLKKAYKQNFQKLPRITSFIGTSNRTDLLTDPTGSRRFICVEVKQAIDCTHINHNQIYAQLLHELNEGERYWFNHEEEAQIQQHNAAFYRATPEEELFRAHFRAPGDEEEGELLSLDEIFSTLQSHHKGLMRNLNLNRFGSAIVASGIDRIHTRYGNRYRVVRI